MGIVNRKDIPAKQNSLGQFFTPDTIADLCLEHTSFKTDLVVEPSCGKGVFLDKIRQKTKAYILGLEVDSDVIKLYKGKERVETVNFYDFELATKSDVTFIGNPPYRTPAISVTDDPKYGRRDKIKQLKKKYDIAGIREEAVFFIVKSVDLILRNQVKGHIYYILPKTIFHNNSKAYQSFFTFLRKYVRLESVTDLPSDFDKVTTDLCYVHFSVNVSEPGGDNGFYGVGDEMITFHRIFKKTYLGSVPCESIFLSVKGEPEEAFRKRLVKLFKSNVTESNLIELLSYNGDVHLAALKKQDPNKIKVVLGYVEEIKELSGFSLDLFKDKFNYKPIQHRNEVRHYFRHNFLKKGRFVYQLNPNPCQSFYFPGNPTKGCLDYWGICDYDVNRNCSPSANRTVPLDGIEDNLTDEFKLYWKENTTQPYSKVFDYLSYVLASDWYKKMKNTYQRFYFGVPKVFEKEWENV